MNLGLLVTIALGIVLGFALLGGLRAALRWAVRAEPASEGDSPIGTQLDVPPENPRR